MPGDAPQGWLPPRAPSEADLEGAAPGSSAQDRRVTSPGAGERAGAPTFLRAGGGPPVARRAVDPLASVSVGLGVTGLGLLVFSLGLGFMLSLPCSLVAWLLGSRVRARTAAAAAAAGAVPSSAGRVGQVLGMVGVGANGVAMLVWIVLISSGTSVDDVERALQRRLRQQQEQLREQRRVDPDPPPSRVEPAVVRITSRGLISAVHGAARTDETASTPSR